MEAYSRACPRKWVEYLRWIEHKLRHRTLATGVTPYAAIHGYFGSSALSTALGALEAIPEDVIWSDWIANIVSESKEMTSQLAEHWATEAAVRARKHGEAKREPSFNEGDLVLVAKPFYERGTGVILPQCDGPYVIARLPTLHVSHLVDTLTGEPAYDGRAVSVGRLIKFNFPPDWAVPEAGAVNLPPSNEYRKGMYVAVSPKTSQFSRVHVALIDQVFYENDRFLVTLFYVPPDARYGPWQARRWAIWPEPDGHPKREVIASDEVICEVHLKNDALTEESLEALTARGVPAVHMPRREAALPTRQGQGRSS